MTAAELFRKCRNDRRELLILQEKQEELRTALLPKAIQYKSDVIQSSLEPDPLAARLSEVVDMDRQIQTVIDAMLHDEAEAYRIIREIRDGRYRILLMTYYMTSREDRKGHHTLHTLETVAEVAGYSADAIRHMHRRALSAAESVSRKMNTEKHI